MQRERQRSGAALIRDRHGLERSRVCSASFRCASCRAAPGTREHSETRSRSREWDVLQSRVVAFPCFRPVPACYRRPNRATHATPPARISRLHPAAYGQRRRGRLWPAACFSPVIYREKQGREGRVRTLPMPHCITTSRVSAGARSRDSFRMALLPLFRSRTHEVELERRIYALQAALDQCKGVARTWWSMRVGLTSPADEAGTAEIAFQRADYAKALKLARPLAEAGDPRAEAIVGSAYYRGRGVAQNDTEAAKWFRLAADKGNAAARFTLGVMYGEGRGVPQDYAEAARWYRLAAEQGDAQAQYNLGLAYARGEGVTQDVVDAHMWFNLAAARVPANDTRTRTAAVKNRDTVAGEMSSEQLAEAQKRAREWKPRS